MQNVRNIHLLLYVNYKSICRNSQWWSKDILGLGLTGRLSVRINEPTKKVAESYFICRQRGRLYLYLVVSYSKSSITRLQVQAKTQVCTQEKRKIIPRQYIETHIPSRTRKHLFMRILTIKLELFFQAL